MKLISVIPSFEKLLTVHETISITGGDCGRLWEIAGDCGRSEMLSRDTHPRHIRLCTHRVLNCPNFGFCQLSGVLAATSWAHDIVQVIHTIDHKRRCDVPRRAYRPHVPRRTLSDGSKRSSYADSAESGRRGLTSISEYRECIGHRLRTTYSKRTKTEKPSSFRR